jgi:hypothetical protein
MVEPVMGSNSLFDDVLALAKRPDANFLQLARGLTQVRHQSPDRLGDLIKQSGLNSRRAYYLIEMAEHLSRLEAQGVRFDEERLQRLGWGKLRIIGRHLTPRNANKWLERAERETIRELVARVNGEKPTAKEHVIVLHFTPEQYQAFEEAILQNGGIRNHRGRGLQNKEEALVNIIQRSSRSKEAEGSRWQFENEVCTSSKESCL